MAPDTTKFLQKMREHAKWAQKKAETFQVKEAECHNCSYDKCSRAVTLEVGDMVLVHVTTLKGHHEIQMYQFMRYAPGTGKGTARPYIGTICFPSTPWQDEKDASMIGVENDNTSTPVPPVDSVPADAGPSGMATLSTTGNPTQCSPDQPAALRCSVQNTQNQLPWRYWNLSLLADTSPSGIWDA